jgi:hypothetical protein
MSSDTRALLIGLMGPAICGLGLLWLLAEAALDPTPETADLRFFIFDSAHLVIAMGVMVSAICVPLALQVAKAEPEDVEIPIFDAEMEAEDPEPEPEAPPERRLAPQ